MEYIIEKEYFKNVVEHQKIKMLSDFNLTPNNDITVDVNFKSYKVNDEAIKYDAKVQAISMFSGAGGLDIGAQLAKVKVLSSLDFFEDSVKTIGLNKCFSESVHMNRDIKTVTALDYRDIIQKNKFGEYLNYTAIDGINKSKAISTKPKINFVIARINNFLSIIYPQSFKNAYCL